MNGLTKSPQPYPKSNNLSQELKLIDMKRVIMILGTFFFGSMFISQAKDKAKNDKPNILILLADTRFAAFRARHQSPAMT
jgi:hypothetical protein